MTRILGALCLAFLVVGCGSAADGSSASTLLASTSRPSSAHDAGCARGAREARVVTEGSRLVTPALTAPRGLFVRTIAHVVGARELAALPNGDLLVGTTGSAIYLVPNAESQGRVGTPVVFATLHDADADGVAFAPALCTIFFASNRGVWSTRYAAGEVRAGKVTRIARVRTGPVSPGTDGDVHQTTSVAFTHGTLYVSVGSSCNACIEVDPTRAAVLALPPHGGRMRKVAKRVRNAIALAVDGPTGALWIGGAGQDDLPAGHPYEYLDDLSAHAPVADYGWPACEENRHAYIPHANCSKVVEPRVELLAYSTIIGATFYPTDPRGAYAFPARFRGALFAALHGSWHDDSNTPGLACASPAQVVTIPMHGDTPATPVDWSDPKKQWTPFLTGFQTGCGAGDRIGRPTGIAVGSRGSLFVADDDNGVIYRVRPDPPHAP